MFKVVGLDKKGREDWCWLRFGRGFLGLASRRIVVAWDNHDPPDWRDGNRGEGV